MSYRIVTMTGSHYCIDTWGYCVEATKNNVTAKRIPGMGYRVFNDVNMGKPLRLVSPYGDEISTSKVVSIYPEYGINGNAPIIIGFTWNDKEGFQLVPVEGATSYYDAIAGALDSIEKNLDKVEAQNG